MQQADDPMVALQQRTVADAIAPSMVNTMPSAMATAPAPAGVLSSDELRGGRLLLMAGVFACYVWCKFMMVIGAK